MAACTRCTMHLLPGMSVCTGCGLPLESETFAPQMPIPAAGLPAAAIIPATPNPWRQSDEAGFEPAAAEAYADAPAPIAAVVEAPEPVAEAKPKIAEGVPQDPPGTALKLTFADPLPPLPEPSFVLEDEPLAVPAAYATFAAEPMTAETTDAPAEVVPLIPAAGLTVAPSTPYVANAEEEEARAATANG